jgi:hypothetical protein
MIDAVVLYCSNDNRFFKTCVDNLLECGFRITVVTYSHMWAGDVEDIDILNQSNDLFKDNPNYRNLFINWEEGEHPLYWEGYGRHRATQELESDSEWVFYIDIDEIIEPLLFKKWVQDFPYYKYKSILLSQYGYYKHPTVRLNLIEPNPVFAKTKYAKSCPFKESGRKQIFWNNENFISRVLAKLNLNPFFYIYKGIPFIHHYSWVRSKKQILKKFLNWGHKDDKDWVSIAEAEFSNESYIPKHIKHTIVENKFNL